MITNDTNYCSGCVYLRGDLPKGQYCLKFGGKLSRRGKFGQLLKLPGECTGRVTLPPSIDQSVVFLQSIVDLSDSLNHPAGQEVSLDSAPGEHFVSIVVTQHGTGELREFTKNPDGSVSSESMFAFYSVVDLARYLATESRRG